MEGKARSGGQGKQSQGRLGKTRQGTGGKAKPQSAFPWEAKDMVPVLAGQMSRYHGLLGRYSSARHFCPGPFCAGTIVGHVQYWRHGMQLPLAKFLNENGNAFSWKGEHVTQLLEVQIKAALCRSTAAATFSPGMELVSILGRWSLERHNLACRSHFSEVTFLKFWKHISFGQGKQLH